ncbi:hypothetical protein [Streptomyces crystallinus]|uniref:Uncharacterized protein n=1 Tax=Streptomyces crystallinus TaxID=68191 RepID=A0ABP3RTI7_9ACTN
MAPSAQALDLGRTISSAAHTATVAGTQAKPVAQQIVGDKLDKRVQAVKNAVKAGTDAAQAGHDLVS